MIVQFFLKSGQSFTTTKVDKIDTTYNKETGKLTSYNMTFKTTPKNKPHFIDISAVEAIVIVKHP